MNAFKIPIVNITVIILTVVTYVVVGTVIMWSTSANVKTLMNAVLLIPVLMDVRTVQIPPEVFTVRALKDTF